jgi:hypothetical protein
MMLDLARSHAAAWRLGRSHFDYTGDPPRPRGMLIGEAPGPNTNVKLPLFPEPNSSAAGRLLRYASIEPSEWMGKLMRMNLCYEQWSDRRALGGVVQALTYLLDEANWTENAPLRVLLLGRRVADAWNCGVAQFGFERRQHGDVVLQLAWIPHPSGRCILYNSRVNQLRARRAVLWATGERLRP